MTSIDVLSDDVLLAIFDFYINDYISFEDLYENQPIKGDIEVWKLLVHVCQLWRGVVFGSPHHLNLQLVCTPRTPVPESLDIWPAFPLVVHCCGNYPISGIDNILAALKYRDRVCKINVEYNEKFPWKEILAVMEVLLPKLTDLILSSDGRNPLPDTFLGGSALRLRFFELVCVPFRGLPILLLSAADLVYLRLYDVTYLGYISFNELVTCLSTLTSLESLYLGFTDSPADEPWRLSTRSTIPAVTHISFAGPSTLLEEFVARIDCPKLIKFSIFFSDAYGCETQQLDYFISRTESLRALEKAPIITYH